MSHVNIVKKIKIDGDWKLLSIPRNTKGNYDWNSLPEGRYLIEWRAGGKLGEKLPRRGALSVELQAQAVVEEQACGLTPAFRRLKMAEANALAEYALSCESGAEILARARKLVYQTAPTLLEPA